MVILIEFMQNCQFGSIQIHSTASTRVVLVLIHGPAVCSAHFGARDTFQAKMWRTQGEGRHVIGENVAQSGARLTSDRAGPVRCLLGSLDVSENAIRLDLGAWRRQQRVNANWQQRMNATWQQRVNATWQQRVNALQRHVDATLPAFEAGSF